MALSLSSFIRALPKTETHLHIEGALPYELLHAWKPETYPESPYFHAPDFRYPSFPDFDGILLGHALPWFVSAERYHQAAAAIFDKHVRQNIRYVETSFHLPVSGFIGVHGKDIIAAIRAAVPPKLEVRIFAGMLRTDYVGPMKDVIDDLVNWDDLAGVDLHGFEQIPNEPWTADVWAKIRSSGKVTKAHAGEFDGAHRVREAIEQLGSTRIQHGVRAIEDPAVVALAAARGVTFDVCPLSNVKLRVTPSLAEHPLRALTQAGVRCTISTDDPLVFGNSLTDEYHALSDAGYSRNELAQFARNGWDVANVSEDTRTEMYAEIDWLIAVK